MDYLGWELERQRAALAALLLGGGKAQDGEPLRDEAWWSGTGTLGRYAESPEDSLGAWKAFLGGEAAWTVRQDREAGGAGTAETPTSAWEAVLSGVAAWAARQGRKTGGAGMPASTWEAVLGGEAGVPASSGEGAWAPLSGETGAQPNFRRSSGEYAARRGTRTTEAGLAAGTQGLPAGSAGVGARDGAAPLEAGSGRDGAARGTAVGHPGRSLRLRRGGGRTADTLGRDGPTVFQGTEKAAATSPWGGWETAALRAEDSAKLLSRAVQRDARRYDGGFNIF